MSTRKTGTGSGSAQASDTIARAMGDSRMVRGYEIKREPIGRMLRAMAILSDAPEGLLKACFPSKSADEALFALKHLTTDALLSLLVSAGMAAPAFVVRVFAELSGIPEEALLTDPNVGLDGLMEMAEAWIQLNGIENFIKAAAPMIRRLRAATRTGFSG